VAQVEGAVAQLVGYNKQVGAVVDEAHLPLQRHVAGHIAPLVLHALHEEEVEGAALQAVTSKNALQYSKKTLFYLSTRAPGTPILKFIKHNPCSA
jgi:hypothetical protein